MKVALVIGVILGAAFISLWAMGYTVHIGNGAIEVIGPGHVDPYDAEASANSPECAGLKERFPEKPFYTTEELDARSNATMACFKAKVRYIESKRKLR